MRKPFVLIFALLLVLGLHNHAFAIPQTFDAEGIFIMGDNDTKAQAKDFALQDAKRLALEQAGTYLRSITQVVNGQVTKDEIISIASGVIKLERILNEDAKFNNGIITVIIKARFVIDSDDLQKKIDNLNQSQKRQEEIQQMADLQSRYDNLLAENNSLKTELARVTDQKTKEQLLSKTQEVHNQLTATQWFDKGVEFDYQGNYDSAIAALSQAVIFDSQYVEAYAGRGFVYIKKGLYDLAIADFNRVIDINPKYDMVYFLRGLIYDKKNLYDMAIADYNRAIAINSNFAEIYYSRGLVYLKKGLYDLAIVDYSRAIDINPQYESAYTGRGILYTEKGLYDLAIIDFDRAITINPKTDNAYGAKAVACENLNRPKEAIECYRKFLQYAPAGHNQIPHAKQRLAALGG